MYEIAMYDLEDNYICSFWGCKECAKYFETSVKVIHCHICRSQKGIIDKKRDRKNHRWVRLFRIEE